MAGLTHVCNVHGYLISDGVKIPDSGRLTYRSMNVVDIINGCRAEGRFGFEEVVWLLIFGKLPMNASITASVSSFTKTASCRNTSPRTSL